MFQLIQVDITEDEERVNVMNNYNPFFFNCFLKEFVTIKDTDNVYTASARARVFVNVCLSVGRL